MLRLVEPAPGIQRRVAEYMSSPVITIDGSRSLTDADEEMRARGISALVVVDGARPSGLLSRTDLLRVATGDNRPSVAGPRRLTLPAGRVSDLCTPFLVTVSPEDSVASAAREMVTRHIHRVPVRRGDELVGVLSTKDVMVAVREARIAAPISSWMSAPLLAVQATDSVASALERLTKGDVTALVVMEGTSTIGLFTQVEALAARQLPGETPVEEAMSQALLCLPQATPTFRAAGFAVSTVARRVLAVEHHHAVGFLSGIDFARAAAGSPPDDDALAAAQ
jgi:CBS domain-containing protein